MGRCGSLEVVCGSMYSGKTEELMRRLKRAEYAKRNILTIKHHIDNRSSYACIVSHDGNERKAHAMDSGDFSIARILDLAEDDIHIVGIDEAQFFSPEIVDVIKRLIERGKRVICAGLDLDFRGQPFGVMPTLMSMADSVVKLRAICVSCGSDANHTQRLINGKPARFDDPTILVGAQECYEARCRDCFVMAMPGAEVAAEHLCHA